MQKSEYTTFFHERIEPILDVYNNELDTEDAVHFGQIMIGAFKYSLYGEIISLTDKHDQSYLKGLINAIEVSKAGQRRHNIMQTVKSQLRVATDEQDMRIRMTNWADDRGINLTEEEIQYAVDQFNKKAGKKIEADFKQDDVAEELKKRFGVGKYSK